MTQQSTIAAAGTLPRPQLWGIGRYHVGGEPVDFPIGWDDIERDTQWAVGMLAGYGVGRGSTVLFVSAGYEAPWTIPLMTAVRRLGGTVSCSEIWGWDARRTELFARRLALHLIVGLTADVASGLDDLGGTAAAIGHIPYVLARPDAGPTLRRAGLEPGQFMPLGPATALECVERLGAHVNGAAWDVTGVDGQLHVNNAVVGVAGTVASEPCPCGSSDPRVRFS